MHAYSVPQLHTLLHANWSIANLTAHHMLLCTVSSPSAASCSSFCGATSNARSETARINRPQAARPGSGEHQQTIRAPTENRTTVFNSVATFTVSEIDESVCIDTPRDHRHSQSAMGPMIYDYWDPRSRLGRKLCPAGLSSISYLKHPVSLLASESAWDCCPNPSSDQRLFCRFWRIHRLAPSPS